MLICLCTNSEYKIKIVISNAFDLVIHESTKSALRHMREKDERDNKIRLVCVCC